MQTQLRLTGLKLISKKSTKSRSHVVERAAARVDLGQVYESEWTE